MEQYKDTVKTLLDNRIIYIFKGEYSDVEIDQNRCDKENYMNLHGFIVYCSMNKVIDIDEYNKIFDLMVKFGYLPIQYKSMLYEKMFNGDTKLIE